MQYCNACLKIERISRYHSITLLTTPAEASFAWSIAYDGQWTLHGPLLCFINFAQLEFGPQP